jgi:RimJ/RimL family protein N-acetyltransferase
MWEPGGAELALLIEDSWQRRRLGTVLAQRLFAVAEEAGVESVRAVVHTGNTPMIKIMSGLGHRLHREYEGGMLTLIATVPQRLTSIARRAAVASPTPDS